MTKKILSAQGRKKLVLVDGHALIHRAFHAIPHLSTKKGEMVNAVYGFNLIFLNMLADIKPNYIAVTFDHKKPTFRHKEFKEYKAKRVKAPDELYQQIPKIKEILKAFNIPIFEKSGFEADDLIATLTKIAKNKIDQILIVTGDLDTLQLVDPKTSVYTMRKGLTDTTIYDEKAVKKRYGFSPDYLADYKGLRGDPSDNIPGVPGIGEKTASDLIKKYQTIENIYKNLDQLPERTQKNLKQNKEQAKFSKKLGQLIYDVPLEFKLPKCLLADFDREKVIQMFQELEFKSLLPKLPDAKVGKQVDSAQGQLLFDQKSPQNTKKFKIRSGYKIIKSKKEIFKLVKKLSQSKGIAVDVETDKLDPVSGKLIGVSFSPKPKQAFYVPIKNEKDLVEFKQVLENPKIEKYGHNLKYDYMILKHHGIDLNPISFDTMIASYLLNPQTRAHSLDQAAFVEFGLEMIPITDLIGKGKDQKPLNQVSLDRLADYSCEDADCTMRLYKLYKLKIISEKLDYLFYKIEMPLVKVLADMELTGVKIDSLYLAKLGKEISKNILKLKKDIYKLSGSQFNISSTQQLSKILFEDLKIPKDGIKKTKTGISTAASELEKLKGKHKIIDLIIQYRELTKLKNTYLDALPKLVSSQTNRIHTNFNQTITATGRLSSSKPNLQNIPARTEIGQRIRKAFTADSGFKIVSFDYSQIELRVAAAISKDPKMSQSFRDDKDIHAATAAEIFNVPITKVTKNQRRVAKTVNFGILYGMSAFGLSQSLGMKRQEARKYIEKYFSIYKGVKEYTDQIIAKTKIDSVVETLSGRKRFLPEINSGIIPIQNAAQRMAINFPFQGTAADIIKLAMIEIHKALPKISPKTKLVLQVHDELVFEIPKNEITKVSKKIKNIMESAFKLDIPIKVDIKTGNNWQELKEIT